MLKILEGSGLVETGQKTCIPGSPNSSDQKNILYGGWNGETGTWVHGEALFKSEENERKIM